MKPFRTFLVVFILTLSLTPSAAFARHRGGHAKRKSVHHSQGAHRAHQAHKVRPSTAPEEVSEEALRDPPAHETSPVWDFWRSVLEAREKLNNGDAPAASALLAHLPPPPTDIINRHQSFYRRLYKQALETGRAASEKQGQSQDDWNRQLWTLFPDFPGFSSSEAPDGILTADKITRLHLLFQKSLFDAVPGLLSIDEIGGADVSSEDKCRAFFELGMSLQKMKQHDEAIEAYGRVDQSSCEDKVRTRALYWKGTLQAEMKQYDDAEETFQKLAKSGDGRYTDDAYYHLYKICDDKNDDERAQRALRHLLELSEGDLKEKYLWDEAFSAYQQQDYDKAVGFLDRIISTRSIGTEAQPQALYWKGRIQEIQSHKKLGGESAGLYRKILKIYPFSFYAIFAEVRLGEASSAPAIEKSKTSFPSDHSLEEAIRVVDKLNRKGDHEAALDTLDYLTYLHPEIFKEKPEVIAQRWIDSCDFNRALEIATESLDKSVFDINLKKDSPLTRAMYPQAYPDEVKEASHENQLPLGLILGIMREESLFIHDIRSHAGAVGLMQLMPLTARLKAHRLGSSVSYGDLSVPASNIQLGSSFLKDMMDRFSGQTALAVMAYNAGPGNVSKWLNAQNQLPLDEFIEAIPFTETRGYVKRVLRSDHIYGLLLGDRKSEKPLQSLDPPH